jgi:hypothetical protein
VAAVAGERGRGSPRARLRPARLRRQGELRRGRGQAAVAGARRRLGGCDLRRGNRRPLWPSTERVRSPAMPSPCRAAR